MPLNPFNDVREAEVMMEAGHSLEYTTLLYKEKLSCL